VSRVADLAVRIIGGLIALILALFTAVFELFYAPLAIGTVPLPVTIPAALVTNVALVWFAYQATGKKLFALVPGVLWMVVMVVASARTSEGDLVLSGWAGLLTLFAGVAGYTFAARRLIIPPRQPPLSPRPPAAGTPEPHPAPPGPTAG
jgi:hypothetical protein